jgi:serine/threonine protein kinase
MRAYVAHPAGGSISTVIKNFGALEEPVVRNFTSQILSGLDYLHRNRVIHNDLKCATCLLTEGGFVRMQGHENQCTRTRFLFPIRALPCAATKAGTSLLLMIHRRARFMLSALSVKYCDDKMPSVE